METVHMDFKQSNFLMVQNEVIDDEQHFDKYEKWVWVVLARFGFSGAAFPSQKTIAAKVGISDRKVRDCLKGLQEKGWLEKIGIHEGYGTVKWIVKIPRDIEIEWIKNKLAEKERKEQIKAKKPTPADPQPTAEDNEIPYKEIIDHLNVKAKAKFRHNTAATVKAINGRWGDGFRLKDFIRVIDVKTAEWLGGDYEQYLNPDTLFRPKNFEKYLNQKMPNKPGSAQLTFEQPQQTGRTMTEEERAALLAEIE